MTLSEMGVLTVTPPAAQDWLVISKVEDVSLFVTLISMRPSTEGQYTWERLQYQIDRCVPTQADVFLSRLENRARTVLNERLLGNGPTQLSRVNCEVTQ
jgi:hypothetical protein